MTTIAYRDGVLAADSLVTCGGVNVGRAQKAWRTTDGSLFALTGKMVYQESCQDWSNGDRSGTPPATKESTFIHITPAGDVREWWEDGWLQSSAAFFAWGSGDEIATGAMAMGADAAKAVEIAATYDTSTGGELTVLVLHTSDCAVHNEPAYPAGPCNCRSDPA